MTHHPSAAASLPTELLDDSALPDDPDALRAELAELEVRLNACEADVRGFMAQEDPAVGRFLAAEIHEKKQLRMMLRYQRDLRRARLNRAL
jgi:hypothetical protein